MISGMLKIAPVLMLGGFLNSCSHPEDLPGALGAIIPLKNISPGIDNSDWSNAQSKAAWREHIRERNIEPHPFD